MSDIRLSMREFRLLEEKRKLAALSDAEERRWSELGQALGIFEAGGSPAGQNGAQLPVHFDGPSAAADEADGFAEVDPDDIMEVDPSDVLLVEREGEGIASPAVDPQPGTLAATASPAEQFPGLVPSEVALAHNFEWVPESAPLPERSIPFETGAPGGTPPEHAPLLSPESSAPDPDPGPTSIPLTQNFEWVPESAPAERSIAFEAEAAGDTTAEPIQLLSSESSAETSAADADPGPSIPLTQNFEWVPASPAFETSVPQPPPEQEIALDAPVIDLLDSDAMQGELQSNSWEGDQAQPGNVGSALAIEDLPPLEEAQIEPVAQWANEPTPPAFPQESPVPAEAPPLAPAAPPLPEPLESRLPYAADSTSATGYTQVSSSEHASPGFQFLVTEAPTPAAPPDQGQPEGIAEAPTGEKQRSRVAPAPILLGAAAEAPAAPGDSETFESAAPLLDTNNGVKSTFVAGEHRVVVHLIDGQVKRGTVQDLDLTAGSVPLQSAPGVVDNIATERLKAIFFMLAPGSPKTAPSGQKIRLTLQDGREVVGFSEDYKTGNPGFFLRPADERTNTARIFVPRWSVYSIDEQ